MTFSEVWRFNQVTSYKWVMATVSGLLMTTSFISLTSFGLFSVPIAVSHGIDPDALNTFGVDAFSIGLFVAFFLGHNGFFDTRIRTGVLVAQVFLIVPQFLIPMTGFLWGIVVLHFFQGLMIMMVALFSVQMSRWFRPSQRATSLAFTLGAISLGTAASGFLSTVLAGFTWSQAYYITGGIMIAGALVYFAFARVAPSFDPVHLKALKKTGTSAWKNPMTWYMGILQIPLTWTLFSVGSFLPDYLDNLGYPGGLSLSVIMVWGIAGFIAAFVGSVIGDRLVGEKERPRDVFVSRLKIIGVANALMGIGAFIMVTLGHSSIFALLAGATINAFMLMIPSNFWALPDSVFPIEIVGAGAFGMGLISNSADAVGPLVSSVLTSNWNLVFGIMVAMAFFGVVYCIYLSRKELNLPGSNFNGPL